MTSKRERLGKRETLWGGGAGWRGCKAHVFDLCHNYRSKKNIKVRSCVLYS